MEVIETSGRVCSVFNRERQQVGVGSVFGGACFYFEAYGNYRHRLQFQVRKFSFILGFWSV